MDDFVPEEEFKDEDKWPEREMFESGENVLPSLMEALKEYNIMRAREASAKTEYELLKQTRENKEEGIYGMMELEGMNSVNTDDGTFYRRTDLYCSIRKENQQKAFEWLKAEGLESLIQETVNAKTLTAVIKERMLSGEAPCPPPQFVTITVKNRIGIRH